MSTTTPQPPRRHIAAIPYPGRGHINPMLNLCKLLLAKHPNLTITFIITEEWLGLLGATPKPPGLIYTTIPNVLPSELIRGTVYKEFVRAVITQMEAPVEEVMDRMELPPPVVVLADSFLPWVVEIGRRRNVPVVSLFTQSAFMFVLLYHFELLVQHKHFPVELIAERGHEVIDYIPGISFRLADIATLLSAIPKEILSDVMNIFHWMKKPHSLVFTSFYELEHQVIDQLKTRVPFPVYTVGPLIPHAFDSTPDAKLDYLIWLDSQPAKSVLYISLGSFLPVSKKQMDEIVEGVGESGVRCFWAARGGTSQIQEAVGETGIVVSWCDQLKILCHPSVGGFLTHCGWNSTLEGVFAGVPMLTFPLNFDQTPNSKLIVEDWNVGMRIKQAGTETVIGSKEISMIIRKFMDLNEEKSKEMRRKSSELQKACKEALSKGGSTETNIDAFARDVLMLT